MTDVTAVVCAYGDQPHLASVVEALRASQGVDVEVVVVDNGSPDCAGLTDARIIDPGYNTGFAQGCNLGARHARSPVVVFVNSDAVVDPGCLRRLCDRLADPAVTLVGATIVLADDPDTVNSWGNPVHLLGFSWAGGYGLPASQARSGTRASVSGAVFGVRRRDFLELAGMDEQYFMYGEDVDLSLRAWLAGGRVEVLSDATATHHYDFGRNPDKLGLLERNRLITVLTTYRVRTLLALAPLIVASEAALTLRAKPPRGMAGSEAGRLAVVGCPSKLPAQAAQPFAGHPPDAGRDSAAAPERGPGPAGAVRHGDRPGMAVCDRCLLAHRGLEGGRGPGADRLESWRWA
ncbi:MAG: glycosyltransferase family 2 protein [Candidatus Nanopelagicales bacterium]|nr:glycosyltransferase family 2 protein [Candidatus Nanopelagicales bacterium]